MLNIVFSVPNENKKATHKVFREHLQARQLWTTPNIVLNRVQDEASNLAFITPFQLIQGPPGNRINSFKLHNCYNIFYL